jgi:hypothetical protein
MNLTRIAGASSASSLTVALSEASRATSPRPMPTDAASLSGPAEVLNKLSSLARTDPTKFRQVVDEIAKTLDEAAGATSDPVMKKTLNDMATVFTQAGKTGDLSAVKPPSGPPPGGGQPSGGGPPPGGGSPPGGVSPTAGGGSAPKTYAAADTNKDGVVTLEEQVAYDAQQASKKAAANAGVGVYRRTLQGAAEEKSQSLFASLGSVLMQ